VPHGYSEPSPSPDAAPELQEPVVTGPHASTGIRQMDAPAVGVNAEAEMGTLEIDAQLCRPSRFAAVVAGEAVRFASPIARAEDPSQ